MFGIPESHIDQLIKSGKYPDVHSSLIEECGELISAIAKYDGDIAPNWDESRTHIIEEMTHVLVSINLFTRQFNISMSDIRKEIMRKAVNDGFDTFEYFTKQVFE